MKKSYSIQMQHAPDSDEARILIDGFVGDEIEGTVSSEFERVLSEIPQGKKIRVLINSYGGSVKDGLGIYNAIRARAADVTAEVTGYALSIASVIPLAASRVVTPRASIWMVHEPWAAAMGNMDDMLKAADMLDEHARMIASIYSAKTGMTDEEARKMMREETWFRGEQAFELGFADALDDDVVPAYNALPPDRLAQFRNVPQQILNMLAQHGPACSVSSGKVAAGENQSPIMQKQETQTMNAEKIEAATAPQENIKQLTDEIKAVRAEIEMLKAPAPKAAFVSVGNSLLDKINNAKPGHERREIILQHGLKNCQEAAQSVLPSGQRWGEVFNWNTLSGTLVPQIVADSLLIALGDMLAPLQAFTRGFTTDEMRPRAIVDVPYPIVPISISTNPTNFESGDTTVDVKQVTVNQLSRSFHINNNDMQQGFLIGQLAEANARALANGVWDVVAALFTTANFTNSNNPYVIAAANFNIDELNQMYGFINADRLNAVLSKAYRARILRKAETDLAIPDGFNGVYTATRWTAAEANVQGIVCAPEAILVASGLPKTLRELAGQFIAQQVVTLPGIGLTVQVNNWVSMSSRALWVSYDIMFGAAIGDGRAGVLIKSAQQPQ